VKLVHLVGFIIKKIELKYFEFLLLSHYVNEKADRIN